MKKDKIIQLLMTNFYDIEQMGLYNASLNAPDKYFGDGVFDTELSQNYNPNAQYVYMYITEDDERFGCNEPNCIWKTEDGCIILLYQIED